MPVSTAGASSADEGRRDRADRHIERWSQLWTDEDGYDTEVEAALVRMDEFTSLSSNALRALLVGDPVSYEEFVTLHALVCAPDMRATPGRLAQSSGVTRAGMTSRLDRLVRAGLVTRTEDPADRRSAIIEPTDSGRQVWDRVIHDWSAAEQRLFSALTLPELRRLNALLRKALLAQEA